MKKSLSFLFIIFIILLFTLNDAQADVSCPSTGQKVGVSDCPNCSVGCSPDCRCRNECSSGSFRCCMPDVGDSCSPHGSHFNRRRSCGSRCNFTCKEEVIGNTRWIPIACGWSGCISDDFIGRPPPVCGSDCGCTWRSELAYVDIGLRIRETSTTTVSIAAYPLGTLSSPLRVVSPKDGNIYAIVLVDPSDGNASRVRIQTSSGIKALRKYP